jgi:pimeloyl-ACP methyl ester carboxylesterase
VGTRERGGAEWDLAASDRAKLAERRSAEVTRQTITEAFCAGVWGYADDTLCLVRPWGFDLSEIRIPTRIIYGLRDVLAPRQHGDWLAANVPGAETVVSEQAGHFSDPEEVIEPYRWLVKPT